MDMREKILLGAVLAAAGAAPAYAQSFSGTISTTTTTSLVLGSSSTTQTGDSTVSPYLNTVTTVQSQSLTTSGSGVTGGTLSVAGNTWGYTITGSGAGTQNQTVTSTLTTQYAPGTPPTTVAQTSSVGAAVNVGSPTISALSVSGCSGFVTNCSTGGVVYGGTLSSSGTLNSNGTVNVTENTYSLTTSGTTYTAYAGTASFNPSTGAITVGPLTQTSQTTVGATGLTTTGTVSAANVNVTSSLNMNGNKISNVGTGTAATDAANTGQVTAEANARIAGDAALQTQITNNLNSLNSLVDNNRKGANAGIATAVALSGGTFLPGKKFNLTANIGAYGGEAAVAAQMGYLVSENVAINAGVATSFRNYHTGGNVAVRGGITIGF